MKNQTNDSSESVIIHDEALPITARVKNLGGNRFRGVRASDWLNKLLLQGTGLGEIVLVTFAGDDLLLEMSESVLDAEAARGAAARFEQLLSTEYDKLSPLEHLALKGSDFNPMACHSDTVYDGTAHQFG